LVAHDGVQPRVDTTHDLRVHGVRHGTHPARVGATRTRCRALSARTCPALRTCQPFVARQRDRALTTPVTLTLSAPRRSEGRPRADNSGRPAVAAADDGAAGGERAPRTTKRRRPCERG